MKNYIEQILSKIIHPDIITKFIKLKLFLAGGSLVDMINLKNAMSIKDFDLYLNSQTANITVNNFLESNGLFNITDNSLFISNTRGFAPYNLITKESYNSISEILKSFDLSSSQIGYCFETGELVTSESFNKGGLNGKIYLNDIEKINTPFNTLLRIFKYTKKLNYATEDNQGSLYLLVLKIIENILNSKDLNKTIIELLDSNYEGSSIKEQLANSYSREELETNSKDIPTTNLITKLYNIIEETLISSNRNNHDYLPCNITANKLRKAKSLAKIIYNSSKYNITEFNSSSHKILINNDDLTVEYLNKIDTYSLIRLVRDLIVADRLESKLENYSIPFFTFKNLPEESRAKRFQSLKTSLSVTIRRSIINELTNAEEKPLSLTIQRYMIPIKFLKTVTSEHIENWLDDATDINKFTTDVKDITLTSSVINNIRILL